MEPILALGPFWNDPSKPSRLAGWIRWLAHDVAEPGVDHYAERIFRCDGAAPCDPGARYLHAIGFPHVWSGAEAYLAAAFVHGVTGCPTGTARIGEAPCR